MNGLEIQIKDLNLVLSGNEILENINLTVKAGEEYFKEIIKELKD